MSVLTLSTSSLVGRKRSIQVAVARSSAGYGRIIGKELCSVELEGATWYERVRQAGVADKDVQTAQLSIYSEQAVPPPPAPPPVLAPGKSAAVAVAPAAPALPAFFYRATNAVSVTIRQIDRAGAVIGAAFAAGANQAGGVLGRAV